MTIRAPLSASALFTYLATFSNAKFWDPSVRSASFDGDGVPRLGSRYQLEIAARRGTTTFDYTIIEFIPSERVVLEAITKNFYSRDTIDIRPLDVHHAEFTYEATLRFRGFAAIANGALFFVLRKIGRRAEIGLRRELEAT